MDQSSQAQKNNERWDEIWAVKAEKVLEHIGVDIGKGLSEEQVRQRREKFGYNQLKAHRQRSAWSILWAQFRSIIIALLSAAAAVAFLYGEWIEAWAIVIVICINTLIGFFTELKAVRSMEALYKLGTVKTRVKRAGKVMEVDAIDLVPGDVVIIEGGDVITADLRIITSSKLEANESALTGESLPVSKSSETVGKDTVLAERKNMLYKGTSVTRGAGEGVVISTGLKTELGKISALVEATEDERTPLEEQLEKLGYRLIILTLVIVGVIVASGISTGRSIFLMIETGIALAVAAIPEGLPIVATISLARGLNMLAKKNALVNRLSSVETLGATGIICTDKTGTLTENKMTVEAIHLYQRCIEIRNEGKEYFFENNNGINAASDPDLLQALTVGVLCNNAALFEEAEGGTGDPLEVALLEAGRKAGLEFSELSKENPEKREVAFDPEVKMMATWNEKKPDDYQVSVKGAPGAVLESCSTFLNNQEIAPLTEEVADWFSALNHKLAANGFRMIALATKLTSDLHEKPYEDLCFLGLVTLLDPPREDVKSAIDDCKKAGIKVVMITGDQGDTAKYIAQKVGLAENDDQDVIHSLEVERKTDVEKLQTRIFARITPKQKLDLISLFQKSGSVVAMTGDGVNDAPALKKADIGIAMGMRGTQVAKEAADIVLTDDRFSTIVTAVEQGRVIFSNIRKFVLYLISCNVSEIMVIGIASFIGMSLPILPLQILFLNLVTDVFPALALGMGEGEQSIMSEKPRSPGESILNRSHWKAIFGYGFLITGAVLGAFIWGINMMGFDPAEAVTLSFLTLALAQLWHVFNMNDDQSNLFINDITKNKWIWLAIGLCVLLILGAVYIPKVSSVLKLMPISLSEWKIVIIMSLVPLVGGQMYHLIRNLFKRNV